jgi:hypothetical protein
MTLCPGLELSRKRIQAGEADISGSRVQRAQCGISKICLVVLGGCSSPAHGRGRLDCSAHALSDRKFQGPDKSTRV